MGDHALQTELISHIYDAAAAPDLWRRFLERLAEALELRAVNFALANAEASGQVAALPSVWGLDDDAIQAYEQRYALIDPHRLPALQQVSGAVGPAEMLVPDDEYVRSEFFNDFYSPLGMRHGFASLIHNKDGVASVLCCHRGKDHMPPGPEELAFLELLTPHLQRARSLSVQLGTLRSQQRIISGVLDGLPVGLVFVDGKGRFLRANSRGERILHDSDGLTVSRGQLTASDARETRALQKVVATACDPDGRLDPAASMSMRISRPSGRRDLDVMACPIDPASELWTQGLAAAFLVVSDGSVALEGATVRLRELYGLSDAESKLAAALAGGITVKEWATERGVSVETVRWQLKQIFSKTGTSRQPELIRLVLLGPLIAAR